MADTKVLGRELGKSSLLYVLANLANSAIPFLLLPIMTRYLTTFDYGVVAMFQVLLGIFGSFTGMSVHGAVARHYYERDSLDFPNYVGNCFLVLGVSAILVAFVVWSLARPISGLSEFPADWLWSVVLVSVAQFVVLVFLAICQVQIKPFAYGCFQISLTLVNVTLSLVFVVLLGMGWQGRVLGQVLAYAGFASVGFWVLRKGGWVRLAFCKKYFCNALHFGVPLIPHAFGMWAITMTDRVLITRMVGLSDTGVYVVGTQIGMIIGIFQDAFNRAWVPWLYEKLKREDPVLNRRIVVFTYLYNVIIVVIALLLSWIAPWFLSFYVGKNFTGAGGYVFWISLGYAFNGMYKMVSGYIFYEKKTYILSLVTFFTASTNLVLSYFLIKLNGPVGAAQGTMISFCISYLLTWACSSYIHKMPWIFNSKYL